MMDGMNTYYEELKEKEGIDDDFHNIDKNNIVHRLEDVIRANRPNCRARNFKEYLRFEKNQEKD
jgi:accessory colonization factor AcfC